MSRFIGIALALLMAVAVVVCPADAKAQLPFNVGVSVKGGVNFSGMTEPEEGDKRIGESGPIILYPGFFDIGGGIGLFVEPQFFDIVSLETGFIWETSSGSGDYNEREVTYTTKDIIIPLQVRAAFPGLVSPYVGLGGAFVVPLSADVEAESGSGLRFEVKERDITSYFAFSFGVEIDALVIKIPIELRGRVATGVSKNLTDRVDQVAGNEITLKGNYDLQGMVLIGIGYDIDILE